MNLVCFGAHPDDPEVFAGATMIRFAEAGHRVLAVSLTNGDIGHYALGGGMLAARRLAESVRAAEIGGYESLVLDHHDGELMPTLELRKEIVRIIRRCRADIVFTHRPNDYHPDHRYAAQAVQDAAFMVTVPQFCPDVPALQKNPLFLYLFDPFTYPVPFRADVALPVDTLMPRKWQLLDAMDSQFYEWLPWLEGKAGEVPPADADPAERLFWLKQFFSPELELPVKLHGDALAEWTPAGKASCRFAEMFQVCEYGNQPDKQRLQDIFAPMLKI